MRMKESLCMVVLVSSRDKGDEGRVDENGVVDIVLFACGELILS